MTAACSQYSWSRAPTCDWITHRPRHLATAGDLPGSCDELAADLRAALTSAALTGAALTSAASRCSRGHVLVPHRAIRGTRVQLPGPAVSAQHPGDLDRRRARLLGDMLPSVPERFVP